MWRGPRRLVGGPLDGTRLPLTGGSSDARPLYPYISDGEVMVVPIDSRGQWAHFGDQVKQSAAYRGMDVGIYDPTYRLVITQ